MSKLDLFRDGVPLIHDMRLVHFEPDTQEMIMAGQLAVTPPANAVERKIAVIGDGSVNLHMVQRLADMRGQEGQTVRAFSTLDDALDWADIRLSDRAYFDGLNKRLDAFFSRQARFDTAHNITFLNH